MKISYIVPVYNAKSFILRCLDSILSQRFDGVEVVFVDDGSTDGGADILRKVATKYKFCRSYFQENAGPSVARNKAIRKARGRYLAILDVDDIAVGQRSQLQYETATDLNADLIVGGSKIVDVNRERLGAYCPADGVDKLYQALLNRKSSFHHSSCLMRTEKVLSLGGYSERLRQGEDLDLFFRFFESGRVAAVSDCVVEHTRHDASLSNGLNIEESLFFGVFVTACHLTRLSMNVDIVRWEQSQYNHALEFAREWFASSSSIRLFRFKEELKTSGALGATKLLPKIWRSPRSSALVAFSKVRGDRSAIELAEQMVKAGLVKEHSCE